MNAHRRHSTSAGRTLSELSDEARRGFTEFAVLPAVIVASFVLLALATWALDRTDIVWVRGWREFMRGQVFVDAQATGDLLGTIAGSLITVTSITFSLLLLAVQQSSASLTAEVLDQYLRRRLNQIFFGFFVGVALYALIVLSTVGEPFNPVLGASLALALTAVALALLPLLLYSTLDQMRPAVILASIHDHTLQAREGQLALLQRTRRRPSRGNTVRLPVRALTNGFVVGVDAEALGAAARQVGGATEVVLQTAIGRFVCRGQVVAELRGAPLADLAAAADSVRGAVHLQRQRDLDQDPGYGIDELMTIAWTSASTAKQNVAPAVLAVYMLRDLLARWCEEPVALAPSEPLPVVYQDDLLSEVLGALESVAVVSTESMQHRVFAEVMLTFAALFEDLPAEQQAQADALVCRALAGLGDHMITAEPAAALCALAETLSRADRRDTAAAVQAARADLHASVGRLNSRSTRVPRAS